MGFEYDWVRGIGGAAAGVIMGIPGGPGGMVAGGILGGISGVSTTQDAQLQQLNPYTQQYWDMLSQNQTNFERQAQAAQGLQQGAIGQAQGVYGDLERFYADATYDPSAAYRMLMARTPQFSNMADQIVSPMGSSIADLVQQRSTQAAQQAAGQFQSMKALNSGAANKAVGGAAAIAGLQVQAQYDQMRAQILQQLVQQGAASAENSVHMQQQSELQRLQALQAAGQGYANTASLYGQRAGNAQQLLSQAMAGQAQMAGPEFYYSPEQVDHVGQDVAAMGMQAMNVHQQQKALGAQNTYLKQLADQAAALAAGPATIGQGPQIPARMPSVAQRMYPQNQGMLQAGGLQLSPTQQLYPSYGMPMGNLYGFARQEWR